MGTTYRLHGKQEQENHVLTLTFRSLQVLQPLLDLVWLRRRRTACEGDATEAGCGSSLLHVFEASWLVLFSLVTFLVLWSIVGNSTMSM